MAKSSELKECALGPRLVGTIGKGNDSLPFGCRLAWRHDSRSHLHDCRVNCPAGRYAGTSHSRCAIAPAPGRKRRSASKSAPMSPRAAGFASIPVNAESARGSTRCRHGLRACTHATGVRFRATAARRASRVLRPCRRFRYRQCSRLPGKPAGAFQRRACPRHDDRARGAGRSARGVSEAWELEGRDAPYVDHLTDDLVGSRTDCAALIRRPGSPAASG